MSGGGAKPLLSCEGLHAGYSGVAVVKGVSLEVSSGLVGIVGRNGVGKSTLLKALAGLLPPLSGGSSFAGQAGGAVERARRGMGYMPQEMIVFGGLTVRENLLLAGDGDPLSDAAPFLGAFPRLAQRMDVAAGRLSGGEKKMLSFVRAMVEPGKSLLMLDEPTEGVQHDNAERMVGFINDAKASQGKAFLVAEQNLWFLQSCADSIVVMDQGEIKLRRGRGEFDMDELEAALAL